MLRDLNGMIRMHSRKAFNFVDYDLDAKLQSLLWTIESMQNLKVSHVIFASGDSNLIGAVIRLPAWPSFKFYYDKVLTSLSVILFWRMEHENPLTNRGTSLIARSVTSENQR